MSALDYYYKLAELEQMPTISTGQADDLKVDTGVYRVWLSRCGVDDGETFDNKVTVEKYNDSYGWQTTLTYQAR